MTYDEFFRMAQGEYEPVRLTRLEKLNFRKFLMKKFAGPVCIFDDVCEDFWATSRVRETRKYADGRTYFRVECRILKPDCTFEHPLQFLTLLDARRKVLGIVAVYGTGRPETDENGDPIEYPALNEDTIGGLEPAGDRNPEASERTIHVARGLRRALMRAVRTCDRKLEQTLRDYGVDEKEGVKTLDLSVPVGQWKAMMKSLDKRWSELADVWPEDDRRKLCLYLAIQGVAGACSDVAVQYDEEIHGKAGVKNPNYDFGKMLYWFERGAEAGDANCQYSTGYLYRNAEKTQHDCDRAVYWFEKAAAQDHVNGLKALAYCLECGRCAQTDRKRAEALKKRADEIEKMV